MSNIVSMSSYHKHYQPEENSGICVVRRKGETFENLMRRFRKKFSKSGISKELSERMFYEKPGDKKRRKKAQSIRLKQREEEKSQKAREHYQKLRAKLKRKKEKENEKGEQYDQSSRRQNRSRVSKTDYKRSRTFNSGDGAGSSRVRKSVVNG